MDDLVVETQHAIIKYAESMAQILAEAGRASHDATGDPPKLAVRRWSDIILNRALEILRDEAEPRPRKVLQKTESVTFPNAGHNYDVSDTVEIKCP